MNSRDKLGSVLACDDLPLNVRPYVRETQNIRNEIKRATLHIKKLREMKKKHEQIIYQYMVENDIRKIDEITRASVKPKNKRKPLKEKKKDVCALFHEEGVGDPEGLWARLQRAQKYLEPPPSAEENYGYDY